MAATKRNAMLRPETAEKLRAQIQTTQLLKRAQAFALGESEPQSKKPIEMSPHQVTMLLGLVRKTLPDLTSNSLTGEDGKGPAELIFRTVYEKRD